MGTTRSLTCGKLQFLIGESSRMWDFVTAMFVYRRVRTVSKLFFDQNDLVDFEFLFDVWAPWNFSLWLWVYNLGEVTPILDSPAGLPVLGIFDISRSDQTFRTSWSDWLFWDSTCPKWSWLTSYHARIVAILGFHRAEAYREDGGFDSQFSALRPELSAW